MMIKLVLLVSCILGNASGDFDCLCSISSHQTIYFSPSINSGPLGSIYRTCQAIAGNVTDPWVPVFHGHQVNIQPRFIAECYLSIKPSEQNLHVSNHSISKAFILLYKLLLTGRFKPMSDYFLTVSSNYLSMALRWFLMFVWERERKIESMYIIPINLIPFHLISWEMSKDEHSHLISLE